MEKNVIVTRREVERIFRQKKGESAIHEAASEQSQQELTLALAMTGQILRELQKAEQEQGSNQVLITAQHGPTSRLQRLIAAGEGGTLTLTPTLTGALEAKFDTADWLGWARVVWAKLKHPESYPRPPVPPSTPEPLPGPNVRIGIIGDWGTGMYGAPRIAEYILQDPDPYGVLMHLGDVYYAGAEGEMRTRFLEVWPKPSGPVIHRALNSNHDMYSGGEYYFRDALPAFAQRSSYFALQNADWTLIGLDVAYIDHAIDDEQVRWIEDVLRQAGDRKVIFFSHHQLFSAFESQGDKLRNHQGFAKILNSRRIFAWYWGHEHRCVLFQEPDVASSLWGRCIGHGGMPQSRSKTIHLPRDPLQSKADWRRASAVQDANGVQLAPPAIVLEGPNLDIPNESEKFSPHGFAVLKLEGKRLFEEIRDTAGKIIYAEELTQ